jgi:hypothetical protein
LAVTIGEHSAKIRLSSCVTGYTTTWEKLALLVGMKMNQIMLPPVKPGDQLWGIYYTDREYARVMGDPLLGVVAAPTKIAAEETAVQQGLPDAWAHPLATEQIKSIRESTAQSTEHHHITMQPTTADLRTAIEVLKILDQRLNEQAAESVRQLPETDLGDRYAAHIESRTIEQTSHIEKVSMQLQNWRDELLQQQKQQVTQSV